MIKSDSCAKFDYEHLDVNFDDACDYIDIDGSEEVVCTDADLKLLFLNIHGLIGKQDSLSHLLYQVLGDHKIDIVILVETWHTPSNLTRIKLPGYQFHGKACQGKKGGGVGFLINDQLTYKERPDLEVTSTTVEHCVINVKLKKTTVTVNAIYRPPNTDQEEFLTWFENLNRTLNKYKCKDFVIGMDHNLDLLKHHLHGKTQLFLESMLDNFIMPCITRPTRITSETATLIDNICMSRELHTKQKSGILLSDLSDHLPCLSIISNCKDIVKDTFKVKRSFTE